MNLKELIDKKNSDAAILLGCGPSINDITEDEWAIIDSMDKWAINNWMVHDVVPNFYHLEIKKHRNGQLVEDIMDFKKESYKDVNWVLDGSRDYLLDYIDAEYFKNIFRYEKRYIESPGDHKILDDVATCILNPRASLSIIFDIVSRFNYNTIYLAGIDLYNSKYFWTDNPLYDKHPIPDIMKTCKPDEREPSSFHPTHNIIPFIKTFSEHNNMNLINISKKSLLKDHIRTGNIQ